MLDFKFCIYELLRLAVLTWRTTSIQRFKVTWAIRYCGNTIFFQYTDTNICPTMCRSTKHKHTNWEWVHTAQNDLFTLKAARSTRLKISR